MQYTNFVLQEKNAANEARMVVCKPLMPDVLSLRDLCRFGFTTQNLAWWAVTQRTLKNHKTVKIGEWVLARDNTVLPKWLKNWLKLLGLSVMGIKIGSSFEVLVSYK